jgi:hypothetical protein
LLAQRHLQAASRLHGALSLLDSLSFKAAVRTVRRPHAAFRQLLLEHFQADGIASRQGECLDRGEACLPFRGHWQVPFRQTFLHGFADCPP